ncbi:MAG: hypothetical protein ABI318_17810 [Chthoniobacteraceae bacterium]
MISIVINAPLQSQHGYDASELRLGERFVEVNTESSDGKLFVDYARLHETERLRGAAPDSAV